MIDANPWRTVIINYVRQLITDQKAAEFVPLISRSMVGLPTQQDAKDFAKLLQIIYQEGYNNAFEKYQNKLKELGYKVTYNDKMKDNPIGKFEYKINQN